MIIDLLAIWRNTAPQKETDRLKALNAKLAQNTEYKPSPDDLGIQSSFEFKESPQVVFVKSQDSLEVARSYHDLPSIDLTEAEKGALEANEKKLAENPKFYNGDHILLTGVLYDDQANRIYLSGYQVKFAFIKTLQANKFPKDSPVYSLELYQTGVLAPFMTQDDYTFVMKRNDAFKLNSVAGGFLEPYVDAYGAHINSHNPSRSNLVTHTARKEALEEFLETESGSHTARIPFMLPQISSVSFWSIAGTRMRTIEFVAPVQLQCRKTQLMQLLDTNNAKDRHEHTGQYTMVPLGSAFRNEAVNAINGLPGDFLYNPLLLSTSRLANKRWCDSKPTNLPGSRTHALYLEGLRPHPQHVLESQEDKADRLLNQHLQKLSLK